MTGGCAACGSCGDGQCHASGGGDGCGTIDNNPQCGFVNGDPGRRPLAHLWVSENPPWFAITDDLPQSARGGEDLTPRATLP